LATEKVFKKRNLPFRSFIIDKRNEKILGELFTVFILETILLGMAM
jgi:glucose-6-phosphate isomerase